MTEKEIKDIEERLVLARIEERKRIISILLGIAARESGSDHPQSEYDQENLARNLRMVVEQISDTPWDGEHWLQQVCGMAFDYGAALRRIEKLEETWIVYESSVQGASAERIGQLLDVLKIPERRKGLFEEIEALRRRVRISESWMPTRPAESLRYPIMLAPPLPSNGIDSDGLHIIQQARPIPEGHVVPPGTRRVLARCPVCGLDGGYPVSSPPGVVARFFPSCGHPGFDSVPSEAPFAEELETPLVSPVTVVSMTGRWTTIPVRLLNIEEIRESPLNPRRPSSDDEDVADEDDD